MQNNNMYDESDSLFNEKDFDEMQQAENYKIAYKLMRNYWAVSFAVSLNAAWWGNATDNIALTAAGFIFCVLALLFRLEYSLGVSKKGVMNPRYAAAMAKKAALYAQSRLWDLSGRYS
ncbi:MAG: hypothetical protein NC395_05575 [Prevotella sp.]|nr:hypothetical protein [Prevotella sp.]